MWSTQKPIESFWLVGRDGMEQKLPSLEHVLPLVNMVIKKFEYWFQSLCLTQQHHLFLVIFLSFVLYTPFSQVMYIFTSV